MDSIQLFEDRRIRTAWDQEKEEWLVSIIDVVAVLTDQSSQRSASTYWAVLKNRLKKEGSQLLTKCKRLKMTAEDSKKRQTDVANIEQPVVTSKNALDFTQILEALTAKETNTENGKE